MKSCLDAIQIHVGSGFMTELEFERELRDSVGSTLYSGTSEIQRNIIARDVLFYLDGIHAEWRICVAGPRPK